MPEPISLDLLAKPVQAIRNELREIKYNAENDRRNVRSQFDNVAATHGSQLGDIEARLSARLDIVETLLGDRFGYLDERIAGLEAQVGRNGQHMERLIALVEKIARDK